MGARCEQYVEDEERAPAEDEREKNESQDLVRVKRATIIELRSLVTREISTATEPGGQFTYLGRFLLGRHRICRQIRSLSLVQEAQFEVERRGNAVEVYF